MQDENGEPVSQQASAMMDMLQQTQGMMQILAQQFSQANRPKRVIRDQNGDIVGIEPVEMAVN